MLTLPPVTSILAMEQLPNLYLKQAVKVYKMNVLLMLLKMAIYHLVTLWPLVLGNYPHVRKLFTPLERHTMAVRLKR